MKVIRTAALVAAAGAAISRAKDYARENPQKASETIDKAESFFRGKAGPKYSDKVGKGSSALRRSLGLSAGSSTASSAPATTRSEDGTTSPSVQTSDGSSPTTPAGYDPSI
ncbi:MAG TPA: antitoxin [Ornithinibacter sp.]|jgi:hypothetical protein|nr:antitoxin [Ornithinibacter sp.]